MALFCVLYIFLIRSYSFLNIMFIHIIYVICLRTKICDDRDQEQLTREKASAMNKCTILIWNIRAINAMA